MRLKDKELEKVVCFKIGKHRNEEIEEKDLENVSEVNISNRKFSGQEKNVSLEELRLFPNLKSLSLQYFKIDDSVIEILNSLKKLETLQLSSCCFKSSTKIENEELKTLKLNCCDIKNYSFLYAPETLTVIGSNNFRLSKISGKENIERMYLQDSNVKDFETIAQCVKLKSLNLDGSKVDNKAMLDELKSRIEVSHLDEYLPIR